jgi:hypothetical protein
MRRFFVTTLYNKELRNAGLLLSPEKNKRLGGLITYLLLAIYCRKHHQEKVSIKRVRELRIKIQNEARAMEHRFPGYYDLQEHGPAPPYAKT